MTDPTPGESPAPDHGPDPAQPPYEPSQEPTQPGSPAAPYGQPGPQPGYPPPAYPGGYPPTGYPAGGYPSTGYPPPRGTNVMAILSLVMAFVFAPAGIVLGHVARKQIQQTGEEGAGLATAGMITSYVITGLYLLMCCGWLGFMIYAYTGSATY